MSDMELRYAQIEKELLAIVFACECFESYMFGRDVIRVESDHKPLEAIFSKPLHSVPKQLQRMLLRLQQYNLQVVYKKGTQMFLADTLSRAFLREINACDFSNYGQAYAKDGQSRSDLPESLYLYFNIRHLLTVQNDLVFKGQCLVVPASLRKELMAVVHSSHIGMERCIRRAHDTLLASHGNRAEGVQLPSVTYVCHTAWNRAKNPSYNTK